VGATLAHLLGLHGLSVVAIERERAPYPLPRAVHLDGEAMRVFQTIGIADALAPVMFVNKGMQFVDPQGRLLIKWPRPQAVSDQGWHASYRFHQPDLETLLRDTLDRFAQHTVVLNAEAVGAAEDEVGVTLTVRTGGSSREDAIRCRYLIGCDGARSVVREWIGANYIDLHSDAEWIVVDVLMKRPLPDLSDWTIQLCDPARPTTLARGTGDRRRWEFMVMPDDDRTQLERPEFLWSLLSRWIGPEDASLERAAVYRFNAVIATPWRRGRMLIAGDAAHRTPPFLGQGLCAGIRDAANLAWKLAWAIAGRGDAETLLESYEGERRPHVSEFVAQAVRVGEVLQSARQIPPNAETEHMDTPAPRLGPGLHDAHDPLAGRLAAQPLAADGQWLDDVVGQNFALIVRDSDAGALPESLRSLCAERQVAIFPAAQGFSPPSGICALLVRPDRYIFGGAKSFGAAEMTVQRLAAVPSQRAEPSLMEQAR